MPKILNFSAVELSREIILQNKELAGRLGTNERFIRDMVRGGFRLPCRITDAIEFLRENPHPTRFRHMKARPISSRLRASCRR